MIKGKLLILLFVILVGCTSTNKKMETHPTNNENALEALDKFWELLNMFDNIPNPESYPKCFELCMKLYKYYKSRKK